MDFTSLTIDKAHEGLSTKKFTAQELVLSHLNQIQIKDSKIRAFLTVCAQSALDKAKEVDRKIKEGKPIGMLEGIPYSAKDAFLTKGIKTTASSKILESFIPPYSATVVDRLDKAGAILIGKTNHDAFGFGSSTENSDYQVTKNPWNITKVPGGSSGGSAAAVSSGMGLFSLAEDTGGSIRQPASFCGVTGIKVTYGRVSRYGVIAYGSSLDTVGVISRSVVDAAYVLEVIAGKDPKDATTLSDSVELYSKSLKNPLKGLKIGVPKEYFSKGLDLEVEKAVLNAVKTYQSLGCVVSDVSLPNTPYAIAAYYLSGISEVSANLSRYDGIRFGYRDPDAKTIEQTYLATRAKGFGDEVKRRIMLGTYALSAGYYDAYYKKAQQVRTLIKSDFDEAFKRVDILIAPVSPTPPFDIGSKSSDPLAMWLADAYTVTINPAGVPALSIPCGFTRTGLAIGMQLIGPHLSESNLFQAGYTYQQKTDWHTKQPPI